MAAPSWWETMLAAVRAQESGGNYSQDSAGCLGAYCWSDQSSWDNMAKSAGQSQYVGQNPATLPPKVQDTVASTNMGHIYNQTHSITAVLEWWNGGQTHSVPNRGLPAQHWAKNCGGGSTAAYACQVETRMKLGGHFLAGAGTGSGSGGVVQVSAVADCLIGFGGIPGTSWISDIFGGGGNIGSVCLFTRSEARGLMGAILMGAGAVMALPGLFLLIASAGMKAAGPLGPVAEKTGAAVALIPGAEGVGVGVAAAGKVASSSAKQTQQRRQAKKAKKRKPAEESEKPAELTEAA